MSGPGHHATLMDQWAAIGQEHARQHLAAIGVNMSALLALMPAPVVGPCELAARLDLLTAALAYTAQASLRRHLESLSTTSGTPLHAAVLDLAASVLRAFVQLERDPERAAIVMIAWVIDQREMAAKGVLTEEDLNGLDMGTITGEQANALYERFPDAERLMAFLGYSQVEVLMAAILQEQDLDVAVFLPTLAEACQLIEQGVHLVPRGTPRAQA